VKGFFRSGPVQGFLSLILAFYLWLILRTIRWRRINAEPIVEVISRPGGMIACFWHGRIALSIAAQPLVVPGRPARLLISTSPDGEFIAQAMARMSLPSFRGSSRKSKDPKRQGSGGAAYRQSLEWLEKQGGVFILTPDGPRGPAEQMADGVMRIAQRTGAPVFLMGFAARPCKRLKTWDSMVLPLPFGRGAMVFEGPVRFEPGDDLEAARRDWAARLTRATQAAEAAIA
jgi:lysophospholipid acyltransferase (LPLAT)-like uncharacterized protein